MVKVYTLMSTGLAELDRVIQGVWPGDNIVWQVNSIEEYISFAHPYCRDVRAKGNELIYFRFAEHPSLLPEGVKAVEYHLHPEEGFESFLAEIFKVIEKTGHGAFYLFDCLSELTVDWYSDQMLANFFMLTCPYLYEYDTVTYFSLLKNSHTAGTINSIHDTAQVIIDVFKDKEDLYLQPLKVFKRYSKTMYMLHHWKNGALEPVTKSTVISDLLKNVPHNTYFSANQLDMWNRIFARAQEIQGETEKTGQAPGEYEEYRQRLLRMVITRDKRLLSLAEKYFSLQDLIDVGKHMIGTGLAGGKTAGMLLARAILRKKDSAWQDKLEPHDSFYIGSDVFYTYLIMSKCWWARWRQRQGGSFLEEAEEAHNRMLSGTFPQDIQDRFREVLNYFGQSPIIVRSSSLLEDAYGNSFSGKYESVFCANQGTPDERLEDFMNAVRKVYSSTMNRDALQYRYHRGLLNHDEQMALLIQRVSGSFYSSYFFPQIAGVGFSYNLYAWNKEIDPKAGVLRLVFGLGTRAVNRSDDDYTRIVAVNEPQKRPESSFDEIRRYAQRKIDVLNLESNGFESDYFTDMTKNIPESVTELFAQRDSETGSIMGSRNADSPVPWIINFDRLFSETDFIKDIREILKLLQEAYSYPVDIEFTANFNNTRDFRINLLQCRPYQVKKGEGVTKEPGNIKKDDMIIETRGPIIGTSVHKAVDMLIYIVPEIYGRMPEKDRYSVARLIGKITNHPDSAGRTIMLLGPGRWGTTTPSLGVPVQFGEIKNVSVLCEIAEMREGLVPDVSLGTHFFNDLVELDILYMALYPNKKDYLINRKFLTSAPNLLKKLLSDSSKWAEAVRVIGLPRDNGKNVMYLNVNSVEQKALCYMEKERS